MPQIPQQKVLMTDIKRLLQDTHEMFTFSILPSTCRGILYPLRVEFFNKFSLQAVPILPSPLVWLVEVL